MLQSEVSLSIVKEEEEVWDRRGRNQNSIVYCWYTEDTEEEDTVREIVAFEGFVEALKVRKVTAPIESEQERNRKNKVCIFI